MTGARVGYRFALGAAVLVLLGSMAAVATHAGSTAPFGGSGGTGKGGGMMGGTRPRVATTCAPPADLPGTTVQVTVADMGMSRMIGDVARLGIPMRLVTSTATAQAGPVSFVVANLGSRSHELVILPLAGGQSPGSRAPGSDGKIDEAGSLGEASASCGAGAGDGIESGRVGWVTVNLPAGRYELICNEPNHYADGMWQELDVT